MKIIHTADIHLGAPINGFPKEISEERKTLEKAGEEKLKLETEKKELTDNADKLGNLKTNVTALEKSENDYSQALQEYNNKQSAFEKLVEAVPEVTKFITKHFGKNEKND